MVIPSMPMQSRSNHIRLWLGCLLFAGLFMLVHLWGCAEKKPPAGEAALRNWYHLQQDSLGADLALLDSFVNHGGVQADLQRQFSVARLRYKKIEGIIEYYFQGLTRRINGPALPDIKTEDNLVWPPHGFQVIEQYLFTSLPDSIRPIISNELKLLQTDLQFVRTNMDATAILPRHVHELVQQQIIRIGTLGITGFDAPVSLQSLPEARAALLGISELLAHYSPDVAKAGREIMGKTLEYLAQHTDFNAFDRMKLLQDYLAPLSEVLNSKEQAKDSSFSKPFQGTLAQLLRGKGFDPDYYTNYAAAKTNAEKIALGKQLFYDNTLSRSGRLSCAGCHQPQRMFTDGLAKAANKIHGGSLPRNTPTLLYASLQRDLFYDHRSATLEDQVNEVMANKEEFDYAAQTIARQLAASKNYREAFRAAFETDTISGYEVRNAMAAYLRTLNPFRSRFDAYLGGNKKAMNATELQGFNLFAGKAKCATCHFIPLFNGTVPPLFTKSESEIIGVPQKAVWQNAIIDPDIGRYKWNKLEELKYAFKTPTVRNSAATAPYMHNGVYKTLEEVITFYNKGGGAGIGIDLPHQTLPFDSLQLHKKEQQAIIAFLRTLTDN